MAYLTAADIEEIKKKKKQSSVNTPKYLTNKDIEEILNRKNNVNVAPINREVPTKKSSAVGTAGRILTGVGTGFLKGSEAMADAMQYGAANVAGWVGADKAKKALIENAKYDSTKVLTGNAEKFYDPIAYKPFKSGGFGSSVAEGVGQVASMIGSAGLLGGAKLGAEAANLSKAGKVLNTAKTLLPSAIQGYGGGVTTGLEKGNPFNKSQAYGLGNAVVQAGSEGLFGGIGGVFGKGALDDMVVKGVTKRIKSNLGKNIARIGIKSAGEGLEENIAGVLDPILQKMTIDKNAQGYFTDENGKFTLNKAGQDFLVGAATSALLQSPSITQKNIETKQDNENQPLESDIQTNVPTNINIQQPTQQVDNTGKQVPQEVATQLKDSKVRDEQGNLLKVYHGTNAEFDAFDNSKQNYSGWLSKGIYFTKDMETAKNYGKNIQEVYLDLKNPLILEQDKINSDGTVDFAKSTKEQIYEKFPETRNLKWGEVSDFLKQKGFDGIDNGVDITTFDTKQIIQPNTIAETNVQDSTNTQSNQEQALNVPQMKNNEVVKPIKETKLNIPTAEDIIRTRKENQITNKYNKDIKNNINAKTKAANDVFYFDNNKQRTEFKDILKKYVGNSNIDRNAVKTDIKNNFGTRQIEHTDDVLISVKKDIRNNKIKVSDTVKLDFGGVEDFNQFKKSNFGKLNVANNGRNIDQVYLELNESYGDNLFPMDIITESEQLQRISEVSNMNPTTTESFILDDDSINQATDYVMEYLDNEKNLSDMIDSINVSPKEVRKEKVKEYRMEARGLTENLFNWKDKQLGLQYSTETMERNFYDIIPSKSEADNIINNYIRPITKSNAQKEKFIHEYNNKISQLKLSTNESIAVQMLGEYKYNPETTLTADKTYGFIEKNKLDKKKIENSIEVLRNTYDELIIQANKVLKEQGYKEIPYRKGYFPHFNNDKPSSIIGKMAEKLGWKIQKDALPTNIAGMTDIFKPGKTWFGHSLERKGDVTDYNALQGYDNYIRGIGDIIYHTENIQKLRSLENEIRYQYSEEGVKEQIESIYDNHELSADEMQVEIENIYETLNNPLPNLVTELREYANGLANKKHSSDRVMEHDMSRKMYSVMTNVNNRVAANMVGLNVSSAFTNFIPITQAWSQVSTPNMLKAMQQSINSNYKNDGFIDKSVFLTNRVNQAERLYKTGLEKVGDKANFMFEGIDGFTANVVVRGKYLENIQKGMNESEAIKNADIFAKNVLAGRDKGSLPTVFNRKNPLTKVFTMFQLEVKNQYGYMFKDLPRDMEKEGLAKLTGAFIKMFFGAWLYNKVAESLTGRKSAFSPTDIIADITGIATDESLSASKKFSGVVEEISQDIPFVGGLVGGGRVPISAALPNVGTTVSSAATMFSEEDDAKKQTAMNNLVKELSKPVIYLVPPFGGGQAKKTIEGLGMYKKEIPGSYTTSGKLRFPVKDDIPTKAQAALFGQYASKEAREYFDENRRPLSQNQVEQMKSSKDWKETYDLILKQREYDALNNKYKKLVESGKSTKEIQKQIDNFWQK